MKIQDPHALSSTTGPVTAATAGPKAVTARQTQAPAGPDGVAKAEKTQRLLPGRKANPTTEAADPHSPENVASADPVQAWIDGAEAELDWLQHQPRALLAQADNGLSGIDTLSTEGVRFTPAPGVNTIPNAAPPGVVGTGTLATPTAGAVGATASASGSSLPVILGGVALLGLGGGGGGGGSSPAPTPSPNPTPSSAAYSGVAVDGYVRNANVYKKTPYGNVLLTTTDPEGRFTVAAGANNENYPIVITGGVNKDTGVPNTLELKAPAGATVISPLSTLVQNLIEKSPGTSVADASSKVAQALGLILPANSNLTQYDPLNAGADAPTALAVQKAVARIATVLLLANDPNSAASQMVSLVQAGRLDLTQNLDAILVDSTADTRSQTRSAVQAINNSTDLAQVAKSQAEATDKTAPAAPTLPVPTATNDQTPTVKISFNTTATDGTAAAQGDTVTLWVDGVEKTSTVLSAADIRLGYINLTVPTELAAGNHSLFARLSDQAKHSTDSNSTTLTIDTTPPVAPTLSSSKNGTTLKQGDTATVTFDFNEAVYNFSLADLEVVGGTLSNFQGGNDGGRGLYTATFTPAPGRTLPATITVKNNSFEDIAGNPNQTPSSPLTLSVYTGVSTAPQTQNTSVTFSEDNTWTFRAVDFPFDDFPFNNVQDENTFQSVVISTLPQAGVLLYQGTPVSAGTVIAVADLPKLTYFGGANANGNNYARLGFKVQDNGSTDNGGQVTSSEAWLSFNITPINDKPQATSRTLTLLEDNSRAFSANDFGFQNLYGETDSLANVIITQLPAAGNLQYQGSGVTLGQAIPAANLGQLVYRPGANGNGDAYASIKFKLQDNGGTANGGQDTSDEATLVFNVTPVNDAPIASNKPITVNEDDSKRFSASDFGFDNGDPGTTQTLAAIRISAPPMAGTLKFDGQDVTLNQRIAVGQLDKLVYAPAANANGPDYATIGYQVEDDGGTADGGQNTSSTAFLTVYVNAVNDPAVGSVTISGTGRQGETLMASNTLSDVDGLGTIGYQWYADGIALNGATGNSYTLTQAEFGKTITVQASYTDQQGSREAVTSTNSVGPIGDSDPPVYQSFAVYPSLRQVELSYDSPLDATNKPSPEKFTVRVAGLENRVSTVAIVGNTVVLTLTDPITAGRLSLLYADDPRLDDVNAIQDPAGNDAVSLNENSANTQLTVLSGTVADGYIRGATISLGDSSSPLKGVETDSSGHFFVQDGLNPTGLPLVAKGGFNIDTGIANVLTLSAPAGATVVNPLTTLVQHLLALATPGTSATQAASTVATALGLTLPNGNSLLSYDPLANNDVAAQKTAVALSTVLTVVQQTNPGLVKQVWDQMVSQIQSQNSLNLGQTATLNTVLTGSGLTATSSIYPNGPSIFDTVGLVLSQTSLAALSNAQSQTFDDTPPSAPVLKFYELSNGLQVEKSATATPTPTVTVQLDTSSTSGGAAVVGDSVTLRINGTTGTPYLLTANDIRQGYKEITLPNALPINQPNYLSAYLTDHAGHKSPEAAPISILVDTEVPTIALSSSKTSLLKDEIATITFQLSEPSNDFTLEDISVSGGTVSNFLKNGPGTIYTVKFTPNNDLIGPASISVANQKFSDSVGNFNTDGADANNTVTLSLNTAINKAPTGQAPSLVLLEDQAHTFGVADFGFNYGGDTLQQSFMAVIVSSLPTAGSLTLNGQAVTLNQTVAVANLGQLVYTPAPNANGTGANGAPYATVGFKVQDNGGVLNNGTDTSTEFFFTVSSVTPVLDAPVFNGNVTLPPIYEDTAKPTTATGGTLISDLFDAATGTKWFSDADGNTFTGIAISSNTTPVEQGTWYYWISGTTWTALPSYIANNVNNLTPTSALLLNKTSRLVFVPANNWNGTLNDSQTLTVHALDNGINNTFTTVAGTPVFGDMTTVYQGSQGAAAASAGFKVALTVNAINDAPTGQATTLALLEDSSYTFKSTDTFGFADSNNEGNALKNVVISQLPVGGSLKLNGATVTANQAIPVAQLPLLVYTPAANANGNVTMGVKLQDDGGTANGGSDTSAQITVTFNITPVNDAPSAQVSSVTTLEDGAYTFKVADFKFDDGDAEATTVQLLKSITVTSILGANKGSLQLNGIDVQVGQTITAAEIPTLVYTPPANANGSAYTSFGFTVQDDGGTADGGVDKGNTPAALTINVTAVNDAPTASNKNISINEDAAKTFSEADFGFSDIDGDSLKAVIITQVPSLGTLKLSGTTVQPGDQITKANLGNLVYTPVADAYGDPYTTLQFKVVDTGTTLTANGDQNTSANAYTLTLTVVSVNDAPRTTADTLLATEDVAATYQPAELLGNDSDVEGNTFSINAVSDAVGGTVIINANKTITFTPNANFNGPASFKYTAIDSLGAISDKTLVTVNVQAVNDAPFFADGVSATLPSVAEDTLQDDISGTAVQNLFSSLFQDSLDAVNGGSVANSLAGIAVAGNASTPLVQGTWQYLVGVGSSWKTISTSVTEEAALLLDKSALIRFVPNPNWNGIPGPLSVFLVDDSGSALNFFSTGSTARFFDTKTDDETSRVSDIPLSLGTTITRVNDAPLFTGPAALTTMTERNASTAASNGNTSSAKVVDLFGSLFQDNTDVIPGQDTGNTLAGIAIAGDASVADQGVWQYSLNNGTSWTDVGQVSAGSALLLSASAVLRFVPQAYWYGTPGSLTVYAVDNSSSTTFTSANTRQFFNTTNDDSTSKVSAAGVALGVTVNVVDSNLVVSLGSTAQDAAGKAYHYQDDPTSANVVTINNFGADDTLKFTGWTFNEVSSKIGFTASGSDLLLTATNAGVESRILLAGALTGLATAPNTLAEFNALTGLGNIIIG